MKNNYDDSKFYNKSLKVEYLNQFEPNKNNPDNKSQTTIAYKFYKTEESERKLNKDVSEFTDDELKEVFFAMQPMNINVSRANGRFISSYISWAIEKGYLKSNIHPLIGKSLSWYDQFVDKTRKLYFSEEDLYDYDKNLVNPQDVVILYLAFVGVTGHDLSEMLNLRESDIDFENGILKLNDDRYGFRELILPGDLKDNTLRIIRQALSYPQEYHDKNGMSVARNPISQLVENDYVIKTVERRSKTEGRADKHVIYRRIAIINEVLDLPYITIKNIQKSGMIKMAKDIFLRDGALGKEQLTEIGDHFGLRKVQMKGYEFYNTTLIREVINMENIQQLYNLD